MGADETPSAPDPLAWFGAVAVFDRMLRDIEAGKRGVIDATKRIGGGSDEIEKRILGR